MYIVIYFPSIGGGELFAKEGAPTPRVARTTRLLSGRGEGHSPHDERHDERHEDKKYKNERDIMGNTT